MKAYRAFENFVSRHRWLAGYGIIFITSLVWIPGIDNAWMHTGGEPFQGVANDFMAGKYPYRDRVLEYPPYSIPIFLAPRLLFGAHNYLGGFMLLVFCADWLIKYLLLQIGLERSRTWRALLPLLAYSLAVPFLQSFFLLRYDAWPALLSVMIILLFCSGRHFLCGLAVAVGIGVKVYPAVFLPPLFILAARQTKAARLGAGLAAGLLPILFLSFVLPWWRFAEFQGSRGIQVESLYASLLWMGKHLGLSGIEWKWSKAWFEVRGPAASAVQPWAQRIFVAALGISTVLSAKYAWKRETLAVGQTARLLLVPLLAFVAFNPVFSPQFMIWLLPLAALGTLEGKARTMLTITLATILTPLFYPSPEYATGLNLPETLILLLRNLILIGTWAWLIWNLISAGECIGVQRQAKLEPVS